MSGASPTRDSVELVTFGLASDDKCMIRVMRPTGLTGGSPRLIHASNHFNYSCSTTIERCV
eukprot:3098549-Amphidinium_carterae.1